MSAISLIRLEPDRTGFGFCSCALYVADKYGNGHGAHLFPKGRP
jgi:hypothetical protein